jgi:hypothetical protein
MKFVVVAGALLVLLLTGCSGKSELVGFWKATSVDMSFAEGRIPPEKMEFAAEMALKEDAPSFDLNSDGSARVFGGGRPACSGSWSVENNIVNVECSSSFLKLERKGSKLTTLPDRTFTFEKQ